MKSLVIVCLAAVLTAAPVTAVTSPSAPVASDALTSAEPGPGIARKVARGGEWTPKGWRAVENGDYLMLEIADAAGFEGALEVTMDELDWHAANTSTGRPKLHFINMFSNPRGEHHVEEGGTHLDALWTLRAGTGPDGGPAYGVRFNVLWASRGAKRCEPSDYEETTATMAPGWKWDRSTYRFRIAWSKSRGELTGHIDGVEVFHEPWLNQVTPLRYVYLARGPDFATMVGPLFRDLAVWQYPTSTSTNQTPAVAVIRPANGAVVEPGKDVLLAVDVSDDGKVKSVEYRLNGKVVGRSDQAPFDLPVAGLPVGWYTLEAEAIDDTGLKSVARARYFTIGQPWEPWGVVNQQK